MPRSLLLVACLALVGCDGCGRLGSAEKPPSSLPAPAGWTLGAAREGEIVLPPPCLESASPLTAVMSRTTRVQAAPGVLDAVVAVEGTLARTRGAPAWRPDAAGVMPLVHGRVANVVALPWSDRARAARSAEGWLVALEGPLGVRLWRDGRETLIAGGERLVDFRCDELRCAVLTEGERPIVRVGSSPEEFTALALPDGGRAFALAAQRPGATTTIVATVDDVRVRLYETGEGELRSIAALEAPAGALAAAGDPPSALVRPGFDAEGCGGQEGGARLVSTRGGVALRSALPASEGALVPLSGGALFAAWLAPARCGASAQLLHAVVVRADASLAGPVTTVAKADAFAVTSRGDDVALWLEQRSAAGGRGTITFAPMRCATGVVAAEGAP